jgi:murein DD-endopeptidase MepM/ murein hydrolase activator NlpD
LKIAAKLRNLMGLLRPRSASRSFFWHKSLTGPADAMAHEAAHDADTARATLLERAWAWLHATFPERQIYIRSDGRVQFFTFGPSLQATLAGLTLIFLGWVAFATVNVIFKDRIIAAKDHRYQQMQQSYEGRVADLQMSYDALNGALVTAEDRFKATADQLQAKQNAIAGFLNRSTQARQTAGIVPGASKPRDQLADSLGIEAPAGYFDGSAEGGTSQLTMMPGPAAPQARTAQPRQPGLLQRAWKSVTGFFRSAANDVRHLGPPPRTYAAAYVQHPALRALAEQTARVARIGESETALMARTGTVLDRSVSDLRAVMRRTGINPDQMARRLESEGVGGPEIPLDQVRIEGVSDADFTRAYLGAAATLSQLNTLSAALSHVPLARPVPASNFDRTSGFGVRMDPFTGRYAFHPGIDFAGPWGSAVHATAAGKVVFAGRRGGYGNMVEIDHGFGIHTRYGHLSKIAVRAGMKVAKGAAIGRVGSTGRSTGPHVHYEVWYDNVVKNPNNFIEAGRHVL